MVTDIIAPENLQPVTVQVNFVPVLHCVEALEQGTRLEGVDLVMGISVSAGPPQDIDGGVARVYAGETGFVTLNGFLDESMAKKNIESTGWNPAVWIFRNIEPFRYYIRQYDSQLIYEISQTGYS